MNIKNILFSIAIASLTLSSVKAEVVITPIHCIISGAIGFVASQMLNQNNSVKTSTDNEATKVTETSTKTQQSERPRINVTALHYAGDTSSLIISGDSFYLNSYKTRDDTPVIIENSEGNFAVTTAGEFNGLEDAFLTYCNSEYHPEGKYVNAFVVQPLGQGRHFDINNLDICGNPVIIQAISEFQKTRKNNTNN